MIRAGLVPARSCKSDTGNFSNGLVQNFAPTDVVTGPRSIENPTKDQSVTPGSVFILVAIVTAGAQLLATRTHMVVGVVVRKVGPRPRDVVLTC
jgi:hypothetical protein